MASYPSSVQVFSTHVNTVEVIDASHPNLIQAEVVAIESTLGSAATGTDPRLSQTVTSASTWSPTATTYTTVAERLNNIEKGVAGDSHSQYIRKAADTSNVIQPTAATTKPIVVKGAASQTANLQEWQNSSGTVLAYIDASGNLTAANVTGGSYIPLSLITTAGDLIVGTGSGSVARLGIGTNGQVLTSNGTTATWAPSSGGGGSAGLPDVFMMMGA